MSNSQADEIWRRPKVEQTSGLKRAAIYNAIRNGDFPRPVKIGDRAVGWLASEVLAWVASRPRALDGGAA